MLLLSLLHAQEYHAHIYLQHKHLAMSISFFILPTASYVHVYTVIELLVA